MSPEQKVIYRQLQLAGLGIVIAMVGLFAKEKNMVWVGIGVFIFGGLRTLFIRAMIGKAED